MTTDRLPWGLTKREAQVIDMLCVYGHAGVAAARMGRALKTVEGDITRIYHKLHLHGVIDFRGSRITQLLRAWIMYWWRLDPNLEISRDQIKN